MTIESSDYERRSVGTVETAVEYINRSPSENFVIYDATDDDINDIRRRVDKIIRKG